MTPMKQIRAKCLDCSAGQPKEVRNCNHEDCALFHYRLGRNPKRSGIGSMNLRSKEKPQLSRGIFEKNGKELGLKETKQENNN